MVFARSTLTEHARLANTLEMTVVYVSHLLDSLAYCYKPQSMLIYRLVSGKCGHNFHMVSASLEHDKWEIGIC